MALPSTPLPLRPGALVLVLALAGVGGCAIFKPAGSTDSGATDGTDDGGSDDGGTDDGGSDDGGTDSGSTDGDGGTDSGSTDGDGGTDSGGGDRLCDVRVETGPPTMDCVTDRLSCGETRLDTTARGRADFGAEAYQNWYCGFASGDPWSGPERVYIFEHPGTGSVDIELNSPCSDHDLAVVRWTPWPEDEECPFAGTLISECEFDDSSGGGTVSVWSDAPISYLVIVDSVDAETDNFELSVTCP